MTTEHLKGCSSGLFQMSGQRHICVHVWLKLLTLFVQDPKHWFVKDRFSYGNKRDKLSQKLPIRYSQWGFYKAITKHPRHHHCWFTVAYQLLVKRNDTKPPIWATFVLSAKRFQLTLIVLIVQSGWTLNHGEWLVDNHHFQVLQRIMRWQCAFDTIFCFGGSYIDSHYSQRWAVFSVFQNFYPFGSLPKRHRPLTKPNVWSNSERISRNDLILRTDSIRKYISLPFFTNRISTKSPM